MATRSIAVLNQKGGTGKTTIATNLASAAHLTGKRTLLLDLDRQGSAIDWAAKRPDASRLNGLTVVGWDRPLTRRRFAEHVQGYEFVVLDGPPRLDDIVCNAAVCADVVVVPCQPSGTDMWAIPETRELLDKADSLRAQLDLEPVKRFFLVNRATNNLLSRAAPLTLADEGKVCPVQIRNLTAFAAAITAGESVLTAEPLGSASDQIRALYSFLLESF